MNWIIGLKTFGWSLFAVALSALACVIGRPFLPAHITTEDFTLFGMLVASVLAPVLLFPWIFQAARSEALQQRLEELAFTDDLTGAANRRGFFAAVRQRIDGDRLPPNTAVMMIDLDHFKKINDTFGHEAGDGVLARVSERITQTLHDLCGSDAIVGRMGGEEFGVVAFGMSERRARGLAGALCESARSFAALPGGAPLRQTISIGLVADAGGMSLDRALSGADDAAYQAKMSGRDRWCLAGARADLGNAAVAFRAREAQAA